MIRKYYNILRSEEIALNRVITKHFCRPDDLPHYKVVELFFNEGEESALNCKEYLNINPLSDKDLFYNYPENLARPPIWWQMPWGGSRKNLNTAKNSSRIIEFVELIKSVQHNGFQMNRGIIRFHKLVKNDGNVVFINLDGHHRLAILSYLNKINHGQLYNSIKGVAVIKFYERNLIKQGFGVNSDEFKWFNLAFKVLGA